MPLAYEIHIGNVVMQLFGHIGTIGINSNPVITTSGTQNIDERTSAIEQIKDPWQKSFSLICKIATLLFY